MKKICVATGTRAEYGILKPLIDKIYHSKECELQLAGNASVYRVWTDVSGD